jgi:glycosyltransferase involved in cell wall biosynthesis
LDVVASLNQLALNTIITVPQSSNYLYLEKLKSYSVKIYIVPCAVWKGDSAPDEWALNKFCQIIEDNNVDVVLANTLTQREPLLAAKRKAKKSIAYVHESPQHDPELCSQMGLSADSITASIEKLADTIWVTSKYSASSFESHRDIHIVGNTVDLEEFDISNDVNQEKLKFALISSNTPKKGVLDLIEIANLLSVSAPNAEFLIIGPNNEFIREQKELQHLGIVGSNVSFIDYLENSVDAVKLTNVILSLSHCQETFARTVIEGMAARRPVLAYNWGALPELIDHKANGYLVSPLNVEAAAKLIEELAHNPNKIRSMGECGRAYIAVHHSPESMQRQIAEALKIFIDLPEEARPKKTKPTQAGRKKSSSTAKSHRKRH